MLTLQILLFGAFEARLAGQSAPRFPTRKAQALLAYLALETESAQSRTRLANIFWPEKPEASARQSLRQTLFYLRHILPDRCLNTTRNTVHLQLSEAITTDVAQFTHSIRAVQEHDHKRLEHCPKCIDRLQQSISLYRGDLLEQFFLEDSSAFEEWSLLNREWLRRQALNILATLTEHHLYYADYDQAHHYAWWQISIDPLREEAHEQLIRVLAMSGRRSEALAQYEACKRLLAKELQIAPATKITRLYEQIKAEESIPAMKQRVQRPRHNLATHLTAFIGRDSEIAQIQTYLENPQCRLLTLCGAGGIGKTQLALHAAQQYYQTESQRFVYYVPLIDVQSPELLSRTILEVLGISAADGRSPRTLLLDHLSSLEMLLILDSFEHLLASAFRRSSPEKYDHHTLALINDILMVAPGVKLMITSRELLNLRAEWILEIGGLPYPGAEAITDTEGDHHTAAQLTRFEAILLFQHNAKRVNSSFSLTRSTVESVIQICRLTEGIPLAIQLAGSLVRRYSCNEILQALQKDIAFLQSPLHDVPTRHRSIRAVFKQSWQILSQAEQRALRRVSTLPTEFDAATALDTIDIPRNILSSLADKSLLQRLPESRYRQYRLFKKCVAAFG